MNGKLVALLCLIVILAGCAASSDGAKRGSSYEIIQEEIVNCDANTAYDIVQRLRPHLLYKATSSRSGDMYGQAQAVVYVDKVRVGGLPYMKYFNANQVSSIEYIRPQEATMRFGANHNAGAFLITTR